MRKGWVKDKKRLGSPAFQNRAFYKIQVGKTKLKIYKSTNP